MDNIYEIVDNVCVKVKNDIACRRQADLIIRELDSLCEYALRNFPYYSFNNLPGYHCAAYFSLLGQKRRIEMSVTEQYELNGSLHKGDPHIVLSASYNAGLILKDLREFINKNYLRLDHIRPSEILEAIPPIIYREIISADFIGVVRCLS